MSKYLSVVIPAYNESKRIEKTLLYISKYLKGENYESEIVVVNDGSTDNTREIVEKLNIPNLRILEYGENRGKGYAVNYGVLNSEGKYILFCDSDNATPFEQVEKLLFYAEGFDVVIGSRYLKDSKIKVKQPLHRRILARMGNYLIQALILPGIVDTQCGFKLFSDEAAKKIFKRQTIWRWGFDMEILHIAKKLGYKIKQLPVEWHDQEGSTVDSSSAFTQTLKELFQIKINSISGRYK